MSDPDDSLDDVYGPEMRPHHKPEEPAAMIEPARRLIEVASVGDDELDALNLCFRAMEIPDNPSARARIAAYLRERFPPVKRYDVDGTAERG